MGKLVPRARAAGVDGATTQPRAEEAPEARPYRPPVPRSRTRLEADHARIHYCATTRPRNDRREAGSAARFCRSPDRVSLRSGSSSGSRRDLCGARIDPYGIDAFL
jgi:hypothetical protein